MGEGLPSGAAGDSPRSTSRRETRPGDTVGRLAAGDSDAAYNMSHQVDATHPSFEAYHVVTSLGLPCTLSNVTGMLVGTLSIVQVVQRKVVVQCDIPQNGKLEALGVESRGSKCGRGCHENKAGRHRGVGKRWEP